MGWTDGFASIIIRLVRFYTLYSPVRKGKYRLITSLRKAFPQYSIQLTCQVSDGRRFEVALATGMYDTLYFLGEYETFLSLIVDRLVAKGDVCIDAGANFGWYTTLIADRTGSQGSVHAFEPVPKTFAELQRNVSLNSERRNTFLNALALSESDSTATITLFDKQPTGHASLARKGKGVAIQCRTKSLDQYLAENEIENVNFLKVDVEGAELDLLKGATRIFSQEVPPVIVMEMALEQSRHFGYLPNDLLNFILSMADYHVFKIDEVGGRLIEIDHFEPEDIGANVLCIPVAAAPEKMGTIREFLHPTDAG